MSALTPVLPARKARGVRFGRPVTIDAHRDSVAPLRAQGRTGRNCKRAWYSEFERLQTKGGLSRQMFGGSRQTAGGNRPMHTSSLPPFLVAMIIVFPAACSDDELRLAARVKALR
jgi:hypothetical protein